MTGSGVLLWLGTNTATKTGSNLVSNHPIPLMSSPLNNFTINHGKTSAMVPPGRHIHWPLGKSIAEVFLSLSMISHMGPTQPSQPPPSKIFKLSQPLQTFHFLHIQPLLITIQSLKISPHPRGEHRGVHLALLPCLT